MKAEGDPDVREAGIVGAAQRQCEFLGVTKQELIADVLEEWVCRNRSIPLPRTDASAIVYWALDDIMRRHRNEFLPVSGKN